MNILSALRNYLLGVPSMDALPPLPGTSGSIGKPSATGGTNQSDWQKHVNRFHHGKEPEPGHCKLKPDSNGGKSSGQNAEWKKIGQGASFSDMSREDFVPASGVKWDKNPRQERIDGSRYNRGTSIFPKDDNIGGYTGGLEMPKETPKDDLEDYVSRIIRRDKKNLENKHLPKVPTTYSFIPDHIYKDQGPKWEYDPEIGGFVNRNYKDNGRIGFLPTPSQPSPDVYIPQTQQEWEKMWKQVDPLGVDSHNPRNKDYDPMRESEEILYARSPFHKEEKARRKKKERREKWLDQCKNGTIIRSRNSDYMKGDDGKWYFKRRHNIGLHPGKHEWVLYRGFPLSNFSFIDRFIPDDFDSENESKRSNSYFDNEFEEILNDIPFKTPVGESPKKSEGKPSSSSSNSTSGTSTNSGWTKAESANGTINSTNGNADVMTAAQSLFPDPLEFQFEDVKDNGQSIGRSMFIRKEGVSGGFEEADANDILAEIRKAHPDAELMGDAEGDQLQIFIPSKKNGASMDEDVVLAAAEYMTSVNSDAMAKRDGRNPLMPDEEEPRSGMVDILESFDMNEPLTAEERSVIDNGVNEEALDAIREKIKDLEVSGDIEEMEHVKLILDVLEKCRAKGLRHHYIDLKDGEIVYGVGGGTSEELKDDEMPEPPELPPKEEEVEPEEPDTTEGVSEEENGQPSENQDASRDLDKYLKQS